MNPERWQQVKQVFHQAVECDPAARAEFIRESCGPDSELRREVESLVASFEEPGSVLESPVIGSGVMAAAAPARAIDPMLGREIGNYVITSQLAHGGMGVVYRGRHITLPRDVVVKCIRPQLMSESARDELKARFKREAYIQSQLDHPHIVRVYEFFTEGEDHFLVMEYVPGQTLQSMLNQQALLPVEQAVKLAAQALDGLAHAHSLRYVDELGNSGTGIIHRDIKPANLLVDQQGNLKLTDFGIAKLFSETSLTRTGISPGTLQYMSPEQIQNVGVDARADLYSLGLTLYELLTGRSPFPRSISGSEYEILKARVETDPIPIQKLSAELAPALASVVMKSLARDPDQRWQSAAEFRQALLSPEAAPVPAFPVPKEPIATRRRLIRTAATAAISVTAIGAVAGAVWYSGGRVFHPANIDASIAVLPFVDMSPEKNQAYFSDGIAEELLNTLSKSTKLRVAGRTSSFRFRDKADDIRAIGKQLMVATVLEGSVRKQGNTAKITVQLVKVEDGFHLWSETFEREMNDIFAAEEEIASAVSGALKVRLLGQSNASAKTSNGEAYTAYLQGRYFLQRRNKANLERAVNYFQQAVDLDKNFAKAWVGLAEARNGQAGAQFVPSNEGYRLAREAANRALALDPNLGEAHSALAWIQHHFDGDWDGADKSYKRALALEPGNATIISHAGIFARILGRLDEATTLGRRAIQMDPLSPGNHHNAGISFYYAGLYGEAETAFRKALEIVPEMDFPHCFIGQLYLAQSQPQKALAEMEKEKHPVLRLLGLALAYHALGRKKDSDAALKDLIEKYGPPYQAAEVYAFRGEKDKALESLERATSGTNFGQIKGDPLLKNLQGDPRYIALLKKIGLPL